MSKYVALVLVTVCLNAASQVLMKEGMNRVSRSSVLDGVELLMAAALNPWVVLGVLSMAASMCTYLIAISRLDISFAFPFISLAYPIVLTYGYFVLAEQMGPLRIVGIAVIVLGTLLVARS